MPLKAARVAHAHRKINNNNDEKDKETSASASFGLESGEKVDNHGDSMITQKRVSKPKKVFDNSPQTMVMGTKKPPRTTKKTEEAARHEEEENEEEDESFENHEEENESSADDEKPAPRGGGGGGDDGGGGDEDPSGGGGGGNPGGGGPPPPPPLSPFERKTFEELHAIKDWVQSVKQEASTAQPTADAEKFMDADELSKEINKKSIKWKGDFPTIADVCYRSNEGRERSHGSHQLSASGENGVSVLPDAIGVG